MTHKPKRDALRQQLDQASAELDARREREREIERKEIANYKFLWRRRRQLPEMIEATKRKLVALETEARRYGMSDILAGNDR